MIGRRPVGWYTGRPGPNTRRLVVETGGFLYDSDAYNDDLPYWTLVSGRPRMMTVSLHGRIIGRPGRIGALARLIDYIQRHESVWLCSRSAIAQHWIANHSAATP
jgi:allantoinase